MKLLSLFSGCGGMDIGFEGDFKCLKKSINADIHPYWIKEDLGEWVVVCPTIFDTVFANDIRPDAKTAWVSYFSQRKSNAGDIYHIESIVDLVKRARFEGTIQLVSGASFPDIVAHKYYGVEVKSTEKNHWTSIGSSILESTRDAGVERIFLTFGKLAKPVQFLSRPYEECMSDIAVTHYPRYKIDMRLRAGETIFDKMGVSYDELRQMDNPVLPVSKYYKSQLGEGESLWWAADGESADETAAPATVKLWTALSAEEKEAVAVQGYVLFPEVLSAGNNKKYNRYALWLATQKGIINTNIRDSFSAGGQVVMEIDGGLAIKMPAAYGRIRKYRDFIIEALDNIDPALLAQYWGVGEIMDDRLKQWCKIVAEYAPANVGYSTAWKVLCGIFPAIVN